jgi:hypothetical protein
MLLLLVLFDVCRTTVRHDLPIGRMGRKKWTAG